MSKAVSCPVCGENPSELSGLEYDLAKCRAALRTIRDGIQLGHDREPTGRLLCIDEAKTIALAAVGSITGDEIPF